MYAAFSCNARAALTASGVKRGCVASDRRKNESWRCGRKGSCTHLFAIAFSSCAACLRAAYAIVLDLGAKTKSLEVGSLGLPVLAISRHPGVAGSAHPRGVGVVRVELYRWVPGWYPNSVKYPSACEGHSIMSPIIKKDLLLDLHYGCGSVLTRERPCVSTPAKWRR